MHFLGSLDFSILYNGYLSKVEQVSKGYGGRVFHCFLPMICCRRLSRHANFYNCVHVCPVIPCSKVCPFIDYNGLHTAPGKGLLIVASVLVGFESLRSAAAIKTQSAFGHVT
jgi:hypothetical protein